jgi:hypothetical protein
MTTYTVSGPINYDTLTSTMQGGDHFAINGGYLTIDTDTRYCGSAYQGIGSLGTLGSINISPTYGGQVLIDGRNTMIVAYTGGGGNSPYYGTQITQGANTGSFVAVYQSNLAGSPIKYGTAIPATGFIKVKGLIGSYISGLAFGGITGSSIGSSRVGWIEVAGVDTCRCLVPRLGAFTTSGLWFDLGSTTGAAQSIQLPAQSINTYYGGVWIESGTGHYEFYPSAGSRNQVYPTDTRNKVVFITSGGICNIGKDLANTAGGYIPPAGKNIMIPNIILSNCLSGTGKHLNSFPNLTLTNRYGWTTTSAGAIDMDKVNSAWSPVFSQPYAVKITDSSVLENVNISECATAVILGNVGVGCTTSGANNNQFGLQLTSCFAGGNVSGCTFARQVLTAAANYVISLSALNNFNFYDTKIMGLAGSRGATDTGTINVSNIDGCTFSGTRLIGGKMRIQTITNVNFLNTMYADQLISLTNTSIPQPIFEFSVNSDKVKIDGIYQYDDIQGVHPLSGIMYNGTSTNLKLYNVGTPGSPYNVSGAVLNSMAQIIALQGNGGKTYLKRVYVKGLQNTLSTNTNSVNDVVFQNVYDLGSIRSIDLTNLNMQTKACDYMARATGQASVYGTHWLDAFSSSSGGVLGVVCNEKTSAQPSTIAYQIVQGSVAFTSASQVYMPYSGDEIIWTMPYYSLGITSLSGGVPIISGINSANFVMNFQYDKNDGNGFNGTWISGGGGFLSGTVGNINAESGIKMMWQLKAKTTASGNAISAFWVGTVTNAGSKYISYPLETPVLTYTDTISGTTLASFYSGNDIFIDWNMASGGSVSINTPWNNDYVAITRARLPNYQGIETSTTITDTSQSTAVSQSVYSYSGVNPGSLGIVLIDSGAAPISWNGKNFSITIKTTSDAMSAGSIAQFLSWNTAGSTYFNGYRGIAWPEMVIPNATSYETQRGRLFLSTGPTLKGVRVVRNDNTTAVPGFTRMQSDDGTYYVSPTSAVIENTTLLAGTRIRLYNVTTATEIENLVTGGVGYSYNYFDGTGITAGDTVRLSATKLGYMPLVMTGVASSTGVTYIDAQTADTIYTTNAIDGSTVTEFSADYPNVQVDINDPSGDTTPQRLYAWYQYNLTSEDGIRNYVGGLVADDLVNYQIDVSIINLLLDNVSATPVRVISARLYRSDGSTVIDSASNSIQMDPDKAYAVQVGGSALTTEEHDELFKLTPVKNNTDLIPLLL